MKTYDYGLNQPCPKQLAMQVGEALVFHAPENPTTGFQWQLVQPSGLFKVEQNYLAKETDTPLVGLGGEKTFRFIAQKAGTELIELAYVRPWETTKRPEQYWQCRVQVMLKQP